MTQKVADSTEMQVGHTGSDVFMSGSSDDLFKALDNAIAALNKPVSSDADREALKSVLDQSNVSIKKALITSAECRLKWAPPCSILTDCR